MAMKTFYLFLRNLTVLRVKKVNALAKYQRSAKIFKNENYFTNMIWQSSLRFLLFKMETRTISQF